MLLVWKFCYTLLYNINKILYVAGSNYLPAAGITRGSVLAPSSAVLGKRSDKPGLSKGAPAMQRSLWRVLGFRATSQWTGPCQLGRGAHRKRVKQTAHEEGEPLVAHCAQPAVRRTESGETTDVQHKKRAPHATDVGRVVALPHPVVQGHAAWQERQKLPRKFLSRGRFRQVGIVRAICYRTGRISVATADNRQCRWKHGRLTHTG